MPSVRFLLFEVPTDSRSRKGLFLDGVSNRAAIGLFHLSHHGLAALESKEVLPTKTVRTQRNHWFMAIYSASRLEC